MYLSKRLSTHFYRLKIRLIVLICDTFYNLIGWQQEIKYRYLNVNFEEKVIKPLVPLKPSGYQVRNINIILETPARALSEQIKKNLLTSEELTRMIILRCQQVQPSINAIAVNRFSDAIEDAKRLDDRLKEAKKLANESGDTTDLDRILFDMPLYGIPFTVKESIAVKKMQQTLGMVARKHVKAKRSARVVNLLNEYGLIVLATTNIPELTLWWADCQNNVYGRTLNPYNLERVPGGSSGGEAALIGSGSTLLGIGTDIGGSLRLPAHFCGIFAHKTTPNIISNQGVLPLLSKSQENMFSIGPMCRYAEDLRPMLISMTTKDQHKLLQLHTDHLQALNSIDCIYYSDMMDNLLVPKIDACYAKKIMLVVDHLSSKFNIRKQRLDLHDFRHCLALWSCSIKNKQLRSPEEEFFGKVTNKTRIKVKLLSELIKWFRGRSKYTIFGLMVLYLYSLFPSGAQGESFWRYIAKSKQLDSQFNNIIGQKGIFIYPTHPTTAPRHYQSLARTSSASYVSIFNVIQVPVTQVTLGLDDQGLPYGLQIISAKNNDFLTISVAEELSKKFGGWVPPYS